MAVVYRSEFQVATGKGALMHTQCEDGNCTGACRMTLPILNLCGCADADALTRVLGQSPGVRYAYVNVDTEMAYVVYDPTRADPQTLAATIERAGFHAGSPELR